MSNSRKLSAAEFIMASASKIRDLKRTLNQEDWEPDIKKDPEDDEVWFHSGPNNGNREENLSGDESFDGFETETESEESGASNQEWFDDSWLEPDTESGDEEIWSEGEEDEAVAVQPEAVDLGSRSNRGASSISASSGASDVFMGAEIEVEFHRNINLTAWEVFQRTTDARAIPKSRYREPDYDPKAECPTNYLACLGPDPLVEKRKLEAEPKPVKRVKFSMPLRIPSAEMFRKCRNCPCVESGNKDCACPNRENKAVNRFWPYCNHCKACDAYHTVVKEKPVDVDLGLRTVTGLLRKLREDQEKKIKD
jgi:hypothetical protein